jgi:hypothetical protein
MVQIPAKAESIIEVLARVRSLHHQKPPPGAYGFVLGESQRTSNPRSFTTAMSYNTTRRTEALLWQVVSLKP